MKRLSFTSFVFCLLAALISTPGYEDITGVAYATSTVTVNGASTDRHGEYFRKELSISNSSGPLWETVNVTNSTTSVSGGFVFPDNAQTYTYDDDGNLTFDGTWTYTWDGENRLISMVMTNVAGIPNSQRKKLDFTYDYLGRRATKTVSTWNGSSFTSPVTIRFIYDVTSVRL